MQFQKTSFQKTSFPKTTMGSAFLLFLCTDEDVPSTSSSTSGMTFSSTSSSDSGMLDSVYIHILHVDINTSILHRPHHHTRTPAKTWDTTITSNRSHSYREDNARTKWNTWRRRLRTSVHRPNTALCFERLQTCRCTITCESYPTPSATHVPGNETKH